MIENIARAVTVYTSHALEIIAALVICFAVIRLAYHYFTAAALQQNKLTAENTRLLFGSSVSVALELLLGADVLTTAVAPSWDDIGKLAAIAVLRTALNYFLEKELGRTKPGDISQ